MPCTRAFVLPRWPSADLPETSSTCDLTRSGYRGSSTHENRIVQSGGDFQSTSSPDRTDDRTGRSIVAGRPAGILRRHAGKSSRIAGTPDSWNRATVAIFETKIGFCPCIPHEQIQPLE